MFQGARNAYHTSTRNLQPATCNLYISQRPSKTVLLHRISGQRPFEAYGIMHSFNRLIYIPAAI